MLTEIPMQVDEGPVLHLGLIGYDPIKAYETVGLDVMLFMA